MPTYLYGIILSLPTLLVAVTVIIVIIMIILYLLTCALLNSNYCIITNNIVSYQPGKLFLWLTRNIFTIMSMNQDVC